MNTQKKYDVFISYSRKDSAVADKICSAFDQVGITYFIDRKGMGGTANYVTKIANEIDNSKVMLLLASANSYTSKYVAIELHYAFNHDVVVLPYALDETLIPKDFEILLIHANWHYLTKNPIFPTLLTSIAELISKDITSKINLLTLDEEQNIVPKDQAELECPSTEEEMQARLALIEAAKKALEEKLHSAEAQGHQSEKIRFKQVAKQLIWILTITIVLMLPIIFGINRYKAYKAIQYTVLNDSIAPYTIEISGFELVNGYNPKKISIPKKIKKNDTTYLVTRIGDGAFKGCTSLTSVTIPNSVTEIGSEAFASCESLISITIPNSVTSIGDWAFSRCSNLTSITIPSSVIWIANGVFYNCSSLTYVTIPNSVTNIGEGAFADCESLPSITIPNSVKSIGDWAFAGCSALTSTTIPNSVTEIGLEAFAECSSLNSVTIPSSTTSIGGRAFVGTALYNDPSNWENGALYINECLIAVDTNCVGNYIIKENTRLIGKVAFISCSALTSVTIPNSVTSIGYGAFYACESLETIVFDGTMEQWLSIDMETYWEDDVPTKVIHCTDGDITLPE